MKIITGAKCTISADGKTITAVMDVDEQPFNSMLLTRVSHGYANPLHPAHHRRIQSSNAAVFLESTDERAAIANEALVDIFNTFAPNTTFLPQLKKVDSGEIHVISELPVTFQWQSSTDNKTWADIAGATAAKLDESIIKPGDWFRLVITNAKGQSIVAPMKKPMQPPTAK